MYKKLLNIPIGKQSIIWAGNKFNDVSSLSIADNVIIGPNNVFLIRGGLKIGNNVNVSGFSFFISQAHDVNDPMGHTSLSEIVIKDDAWVATNSTILPGVTIGKGAVVCAGAVVTKSVDDYAVVAGNPAVKIKERCPRIDYRLNDVSGIKWL
ncbi:acyltransferase [Polynucleobacter victoriensis]|uniref:acyltransferase n=1 Tax=Polynucleobacter victoriensis TaxID=2049319 RepID=UPI0024344969|nr:acyltransferase [Polynucleobacter victoriensis]